MGNDFSDCFPKIDEELMIKKDIDNKAHGPHFDILQKISGGVEQIRVTPDGDIIDGATNLKGVKDPEDKDKLKW